MTIRIGLTGPIGCGKSTVAARLGELGAVIVDADVVAREVLDPGTPELAAVVARFGPAVLRSDGSLDRAALGRLVFADPHALADLERIVHPAVRPRILREMERARDARAVAVVVEAIKLVEGGLATLCDEVWVVRCDPASQLERLVGRGMAIEDARSRVAAQADLVARARQAATREIDTSGITLTELDAIVTDAWEATIGRDAGKGSVTRERD